VAVKCESQNPTGSFKDRGSAVLTSFLVARGIGFAVEDSSGNAGASCAAYLARAGIRARIYVPETASGPKINQIRAYGAEVMPIAGARSEAARAVKKAADEDGFPYASHAYLPFNLPGYATLAYELWEQLGDAPGSVILPVGQGGLLLGMGRGFLALRQAGLIKTMPKMIGVQARACAPLWAIQEYGQSGLSWVSEGETIAEGIRVSYPLRGDAILKLMESQGGQFHVVDEEEIRSGRDELARRGFYVEPTSAVVWPVMERLAGVIPEPVVMFLTGSGLKTG
jgi:threonine synthase